jgi:hypothetical protein
VIRVPLPVALGFKPKVSRACREQAESLIPASVLELRVDWYQKCARDIPTSQSNTILGNLGYYAGRRYKKACDEQAAHRTLGETMLFY